jgi:tRNA(Ile)-lysidine synthase
LTRLDVTVEAADDGMEAAARTARYVALRDQIRAGEVLVTAHHAEDQAETFLLQALRGAGVSGLAAMPALAPFGRGRHWRPWLAVERRRIDAYAASQGLAWVEDASNCDPRYARSWLRARVWPELTAHWPAAARTLARSAAWAGQAAEAIATLAALDLDAARGDGATVRMAGLAALPEARAGAAIRRWLGERGLDTPDHRHLGAILRLLHAREHGSPRVTFAGTEVRRFDGRLFAMSKLAPPPQAGLALSWSAPGRLDLPAGCGYLTGNGQATWPTGLCVVFRRRGARVPKPRGGHEPLSELLRRQRVPPWIRERLPLIHIESTLISVPGRWRHPWLAQWFGGREPVLAWYHTLLGEPARIVASPPFG